MSIRSQLPQEVEGRVTERLRAAAEERVSARIWERDGTLWAPEGTPELTDRLGWLDIAERLAGRIRNAGAIFLGAHTPEAIGDYVGGSNHVLPTARSARFSSGLGVLDFMKRTSILKCGPEQLRALGPAAIALGEAEGLDAHARSVAMRFNPR